MATASLAFASFMAGPIGRLLRIVVGAALIAWGWSARATTLGVVVLVIGFLPLLAGLFNVCLIAAFIGAPFSGAEARKRAQQA